MATPLVLVLAAITAVAILLPGGGPAPLMGATKTSDARNHQGGPTFFPAQTVGTPLPARPADPSDLTGYIWPLPTAFITLPFGPTEWGTWRVDGELFHDGLDMATFCGDHVTAAHDGTVLAAGVHFDDYMGWQGDLSAYYARNERLHLWNDLPITVVIDDGNGYRSMYAHFSEVTVKPGQKVKAGEMIGYEGASGHATGCHLHYGLFSPMETMTIDLDPTIAKRMELPAEETSRVDPLLVLPYRWDVKEMQGFRTPPPGATPPPTPSPSPTPSASSKKK